MTWTRALVTGASSGIGRCFAERLAQRGTDLVLVARSEQELGTATRDLASRHGVNAEPLVADLTDVADLQRVDARLRDDSRPVDLLINNAGFGSVGHAAGLPLEQEEEMLRLNALAVLHLTRSGAQAMRQRGGGTVLNSASLAGYAPVPFFSVYAATKAFVLHFSLGVREELRDSGVSVTTVCPGPVDTAFPEKAGVLRPPLRWLWAEPHSVADRALTGAAKGRAVVLPGPATTLAAMVARAAPPTVIAWSAAAIGRSWAAATLGDATARHRGSRSDQTPTVDQLQSRR